MKEKTNFLNELNKEQKAAVLNVDVNTLVFPEPAPATTRDGPSTFSTAAFCCSFNPSRKFNLSFIISVLFLH